MEAGEPNDAASTSTAENEPRADASLGAPLPVPWLTVLRVTTVIAAVATVLGVLVVPGVHGTASDDAVSNAETVAGAVGFLVLFLLFALMFGGAYEISRTTKIGAATRVITVGISGLVIALAVPTGVAQLRHPLATLALIFSSALLVMVAAIGAVRVAHTRAIGAALLLYSLSAMSRAAAWTVARTAGAEGSMELYNVSRAFSTLMAFLELVATMLAVAWLILRGKTRGAALAAGGFVIGILLVWFGYWRDQTTSFWQAVIDLSLTKVSDLPAPYAIADVVPLLAVLSVLFAVAATAQKKAISMVASAFALALLARGRFDVPLQAMMATVAAEWALVASVDSRTMWSNLTSDRPTKKAAPPAKESAAPPVKESAAPPPAEKKSDDDA